MLNDAMAKPPEPILGVIAPRARPTFAGAFWLACVLALPVFVLLTAGETIWRWLGGG